MDVNNFYSAQMGNSNIDVNQRFTANVLSVLAGALGGGSSKPQQDKITTVNSSATSKTPTVNGRPVFMGGGA